MSVQYHKSLAERLEELNDPEYAQQPAGIEEFLDSYYDLKKDIARIEADNPGDTQGVMARKKALEKLKPKLKEMEKKLHKMRGDDLPQNTPDDNHSHTAPEAPTLSTDSTVHKIKSRTNILAPIIKKARQKALNPDDYQSVWCELVSMAESDDRPAPLTGYAVNEGVLYRTENDDCVAFTKEALRSRFKRMNGR
ncbi:MAG: hypothetical protein VB032_08355 [Burkholderiaceae bacterium]|nr:hypothetical protein [Burkholderiaceae bacterium]